MNTQVTIAIFAGLGGMLGWGLADFFAKKTIDKIGPIKSLVWAHIFGTAALVLAVAEQATRHSSSINLPDTASAWLGLLFFGVLQMLVYWLLYRGFEKGQLAVLSPVFASYSGLVALAAVVVFGEVVTGSVIVALLLLFVGIILVNMDFSDLRNKNLNLLPGMKEVGAGALLATVWTLGWNKFVGGQDALTYALFMYAFMSLSALCLARLLKEPIRGIPKNLWKYLLFSGLGEAVAYFSITRGYSLTSLTSIVALISGAFTVPTILLAYVFLKERITKLQTFAVIMTVAGIIIISLNG